MEFPMKGMTPEKGFLRVAKAEKSPWRMATVGTLGVKREAATPFSPSKSKKKNVLSRRSGPPAVPPELCRFWNGLEVAKALRASVPELRRYQNRLPCQALVPDLVALVMVPMPPNSARVVSRLAVNSCMASTEGCDTLSGLPKLPNVVSIPSTLTLTLLAPAPGVSHLAPLPTCTTPGVSHLAPLPT